MTQYVSILVVGLPLTWFIFACRRRHRDIVYERLYEQQQKQYELPYKG